ncbi:hypothetical protein JCM10908_006801 [Rhodotorula pacifica]|uniref:RNA methyltransferase n=1 Tax=Rhodotorula pacifica TaxID=1495444 RepID=UPI003172832C
MGRAQRHFSITHSPVVRSFIRPVKSVIPSSVAAASNPYAPFSVIASTSSAAPPLPTSYDYDDEEQQPDGAFLIPTQPAGAAEADTPTAGSSDVKGKKRARDDDDTSVTNGAAEYDEVAGTRFGVTVRYTEDNLPEELEKYWAQRYRLFSLFDEGCQMDREGWYSVTPENIAAQIAERCRSGVVLDAFCGVGGNAIQFAFTCERVIALDTSPVRLACAAHNAALYGVADRITFILADWITWTESYLARLEKGLVSEEDKIEVVFLSPPWGGIEYQTLGDKDKDKEKPPPTKRARTAMDGNDAPTLASTSTAAAYPLSALAPLHGRDLFALARRITPNVAYFLPRNVDLLELAALVDPTEKGGERIEVEEEWMSGKLKAVTAYFGELVAPPLDDLEEEET